MWNTEEPWQSTEHEEAGEKCRNLPCIYRKPSAAKQEAYIERMIKRDRELERVKEK